jgi:hypothetical protein
MARLAFPAASRQPLRADGALATARPQRGQYRSISTLPHLPVTITMDAATPPRRHLPALAPSPDAVPGPSMETPGHRDIVPTWHNILPIVSCLDRQGDMQCRHGMARLSLGV